jgi:hypothetical protein
MFGIAQHRKPDGGKMPTDLVITPRLRFNEHTRIIGFFVVREKLKSRDTRLAIQIQRYGSLTRARTQIAAHFNHILLVDVAPLEKFREFFYGLRPMRQQDEPGSLTIQSMYEVAVSPREFLFDLAQ